jgi:ribosomal protein S18 acetylase RimI-like enzyme
LHLEHVDSIEPDLVAYLESDLIRNALDFWYLQQRDRRYVLNICRIDGDIKGHLSTYDTPEAIYTNLGGELIAAKALLPLISKKTVLTTTKALGNLVTKQLKCDAIIQDDHMVLPRGEENLKNPDAARRLSREYESEYSTFGLSFNIPSVPMEWIRERLDTDIVYGIFENGNVASVASIVAWLPKVAVIMGVETKPEFRKRGYGTEVVSAAVKEGLRLSETCSLFVRADNEQAVSIYKKLGFKKVAEELWIDFGTGLVP